MKYYKGLDLHLCLLMLCHIFGYSVAGKTVSLIEGEPQNDIVKPLLQRDKQISLLLLYFVSYEQKLGQVI